MAIHIVPIGKTSFICGLFWQSLSRPRDLRAEALALARKIDVDLMVLRKEHAAAQAGYASSHDGAQRGMVSLAAAVARTVGADGAYYDSRQQPAQNWLGAFRLNDTSWAYFAMRDGNFLPNGDFAGSRAEVLERLHGDYGLGGWNVVLGEPELADQGFHNFNAKRIDELLPRKPGRRFAGGLYALRPAVRTPYGKPLALLSLVVLLLGGAGVAAWQQHQARLEDEERARAMEAARKRLGNGAQAVPHPWRSQPLPAVLAAACLPVPRLMAAGGWALSQFQCTTQQISYQWARADSSVAYLQAQVPQAQVDLGGASASHTLPLDLAAGGDEALAPASAMLAPLLGRFQLLGLEPRIVLRPRPGAPPPLPGATALPPPPAPAWQTYSLSVQAGAMPPAVVAAILTDPGIRLEKLTYRAGEWTIEGVIYAN